MKQLTGTLCRSDRLGRCALLLLLTIYSVAAEDTSDVKNASSLVADVAPVSKTNPIKALADRVRGHVNSQPLRFP
ncbi:MAG: hypothetical protein ACJ06V_06040, partial [Verrucomicrobiota bacterium]